MTLPTRGSVPSPRAKASPNRPQIGLTPAFLPALATVTLNRRCSEAWWRAKPVIYRHFGTGTLPTRGSVPSPRVKPVIYRPIGTATLPTRGSVPSRRAKASPNRRQTGLTPAFFPVFAMATLPTTPSVPSPRAKPVIYRHFGTGTMPTSTPEASWRGEALPNRFQTGLTPAFFPVFATATLPTSPQCNPRVSNRSSIGTLARGPCLQASQRQIALRGEAN